MSQNKDVAPIGRASFTIDEFCQRNCISRPKFYRIRKAGVGPREMWFDGTVRISAQAETDWQQAREFPKDAEARLVARERKARHVAAVNAGKAAIASPKHIANKRRKAAR